MHSVRIDNVPKQRAELLYGLHIIIDLYNGENKGGPRL